MNNNLKSKEEELEELSIDDEIESKRTSISEKKRYQNENKKLHIRDLGKSEKLKSLFSIRPNMEVVDKLYLGRRR